MAQTVQASVHYLKRDPLYLEEKPYTMRYVPDADIPRSNMKLEMHENQMIHDIRGREKDFEYERDGFAIMNFETSLPYESFEDEEKVKQVYLKEVADALCEYLGAHKVQVFEHTIRRRHKHFPISTEDNYLWDQPTTIAHIDSTPPWTKELVGKVNDKAEAKRLLQMRYHNVNFWRPLRGPNRDWPLSVIDIKTVDPADIEPCDLVYANYIVENCQMHYNPNHKWYYLSDQLSTEAFVFRQVDSSNSHMPGVPHSAFANPLTTANDAPRESIEVRALAFYSDK